MPAYLIVYQESEIRDEASFAEYQRRNREAPPVEARPTPLVVYGDVHPLEGQPPKGVILLQFASVEEAKAWYGSPSYQAALPFRQKAADYRAIIVEGFEPPAA